MSTASGSITNAPSLLRRVQNRLPESAIVSPISVLQGISLTTILGTRNQSCIRAL
jgi:hypothetical protein